MAVDKTSWITAWGGPELAKPNWYTPIIGNDAVVSRLPVAEFVLHVVDLSGEVVRNGDGHESPCATGLRDARPARAWDLRQSLGEQRSHNDGPIGCLGAEYCGKYCRGAAERTRATGRPNCPDRLNVSDTCAATLHTARRLDSRKTRGAPAATTGYEVDFNLSTGSMPELTNAQIEYLAAQPLGRLATVGADRKPHVVPTSFRYNPDLGTIDAGGMHVATTKKYRDVQANGWAAIVVDDLVSTDPFTPRMLEIRGRAEAVPTGGQGLGPGFGEAFIRIYPEKINSYGIGQ